MTYMEFVQLLAIVAVIGSTVLLGLEAFMLWDVAYRVQVQTRKARWAIDYHNEGSKNWVDAKFIHQAMQNSFHSYKRMSKLILTAVQLAGVAGLWLTTDIVVLQTHLAVAILGWVGYVVMFYIAQHKSQIQLN